MQRLGLSCVAVLAALAVAACGGTGGASNPPPSTAASPSGSTSLVCTTPGPGDAAATVDIKDFKFAPDPVTAKVGDIISWTNSDSVPHTASLSDGSCGTEQLATGITGALTFTAPGTYTYQCNVHPAQMKDYTIEITQ